MPLDPVSVEITYGLERIAMALQRVRHFRDIRWNAEHTYGDVNMQGEQEHSQAIISKWRMSSARASFTTCTKQEADSGPGKGPGAAGLRLHLEVLAHLQRAGYARRDRRDRAPGAVLRACATWPAASPKHTWSSASAWNIPG